MTTKQSWLYLLNKENAVITNEISDLLIAIDWYFSKKYHAKCQVHGQIRNEKIFQNNSFVKTEADFGGSSFLIFG